MSATASARPDRRGTVFAAWVLFAGLSQLSVVPAPQLETISFHLVWISLALVYGIQSWSTRRALVVLAVVVAVTSGAMEGLLTDRDIEWPEMTEVPLMALVFLTMVWHVRRRAAALAVAQEHAERERRAQQVKELFVRSCSHQMRTPITVARGYAELARGVSSCPEGQEDLDIVIDELDKLGRLASRLLVLADAYDLEQLEREEVDVGALLTRCAQRWSPVEPRCWSLDTEPVHLVGDEAKLEAAVDALIENALAFTADGDEVALRCRLDGGAVVIEVADSGIGFAASRAGGGVGARAGGRGGTGLGLAIARGIAEGHGGRVVVDEEVTSGTLVRIELPVGWTADAGRGASWRPDSGALAGPGTSTHRSAPA